MDSSNRRRSVDEQTSGLGLFEVRLPTLEDTPAPSVPRPGSEDAADLVLHSPFRRKSWRALMLTLAATGDVPLSMADLSERTGLPINVVCARIRHGELRPIWVETHAQACESRAKRGLFVDGFTLTPAGKARVVQATKEIILGARHV